MAVAVAARRRSDIGDVSISEGNSLQQAGDLHGHFVGGFGQCSHFTTSPPPTARLFSGTDYVAKSLLGQSIPAGATSKTFTVGIKGDTVVEPNETFSVNVSSLAGATLADGQAVGTITNDDGGSGLPSMSVADLSIVEGNSGTSVAIFTVSLSSPATGPVTFDMATANGSATAGSDYVASTQTGNAIGTNDTIRTFSVTINGDAEVESNETFTVNITNVVGATLADGQATGTISNDDGGGGGGGTPTLSIGDVSVTEGNAFSKQATFTVKLSAASASAVTYNIATANGTAIAGTDYVAKSLLGQSIPAGTTSKIFTVGIKGETMVEPNETFTVNVSTVVGATVVDGQAVGTIVNDDAAALSVSRVETGGLFDDIEDRQGETVVSATAYATALLDNARTICARAGGPGVVGVDGVESLAVLQDLAETANALCPRQPHYGAVMKVGPGSEQLGFLVDAAADKATPGWVVLTAEPLASPVRIAGAGRRRQSGRPWRSACWPRVRSCAMRSRSYWPVRRRCRASRARRRRAMSPGGCARGLRPIRTSGWWCSAGRRSWPGQ